mgnify:CR=1 FL=1
MTHLDDLGNGPGCSLISVLLELVLDGGLELAVVNGRGLDAGEEIGDNAVEQRQIDSGQLGNVHVLHGEQQQLLVLFHMYHSCHYITTYSRDSVSHSNYSISYDHYIATYFRDSVSHSNYSISYDHYIVTYCRDSLAYSIYSA